MASRLETALPAVVTFVFGLAFGLVAGHVIWSRGPAPAPSAVGMPPGSAPQAAPAEDVEAQRAQIAERLAVHEKLLEATPDDPQLLRTVGNYHALLEQHERALEMYARAETALRAAQAEPARLAEVLVDQGVAHADLGALERSFSTLEEAQRLDPGDVRSRLTHVAILLTRVMPAPPPGFDRREAVAKSESLLAEVRALDPENPHAREFQGWIDAVRAGIQRGASSGQAPAAGADGPHAGVPTGGASAP